MSLHRLEIFTPRYVGRRFDEHRFPIDLVDDLYALKEITIELAKELWKQDNRDRERIPRNFETGVSFELEKIDGGSTTPCIVLVSETDGLFPEQHVSYFENASNQVKEIIQVAEEGGDVNELASRSVLSKFDKLGDKLKEDELIEFRPGDTTRKARLNRVSRRLIVQAASESREYSEHSILRGYISEMDLAKKAFTIDLVSGKRFISSYDGRLEEQLKGAFNTYNTVNKQKVSLEGMVKYSSTDRILAIEEIESISWLENKDVGFRLEELLLLTKGWYEGQGSKFDKSKLDEFYSLFDTHFLPSLPLPNIFPTPEGHLNLEWSSENFEISLLVDLTEFKGILDNYNYSTDDSEEQEFDLKYAAEWKKVNDVVSTIEDEE